MKRKKRSSKTKAEPQQPLVSSNGKHAVDSGNAILRDFIKGLVFIFIVILITVTIEHSHTGEKLAQIGYEYLQSHLTARELPVAVVDISELKPIKIEVDEFPREVTPRKELEEIIKAVAMQGAATIGVDVNFAPLANGTLLTPEDPHFFKFCQETSATTPVILAVDWARDPEAVRRSPEYLLENPTYKDLFALIRSPRVPTNLPFEMTYKASEQKSFTVPTMSAAMAKAFHTDEDSHAMFRLPHWMAHQFFEEKLENGVKVKKFPIDYSALKNLRSRDHTLRPGTVDIIQKQGAMLRDKMVLIGDTSPGEDQFYIPGHQDELVPGVYLHATAAYTLVKAPLLRLTWIGAVVLDFLLAFVILIVVSAIRWFFMNHSGRKVATHRLENLLTVVVALAAIVVAVWFVNLHRVLWQDFVIVVPMLFLHRPIEHSLLSAWSFLKTKTPRAVESVVFEEEESKDQ